MEFGKNPYTGLPDGLYGFFSNNSYHLPLPEVKQEDRKVIPPCYVFDKCKACEYRHTCKNEFNPPEEPYFPPYGRNLPTTEEDNG